MATVKGLMGGDFNGDAVRLIFGWFWSIFPGMSFKPVGIEGSPLQFDILYAEALADCSSIPLVVMGCSDASALLSAVERNLDTLRASLGTPYFTHTLDLFAKFSSVKRTRSNSDFVEAVPGFAHDIAQNLNGHVARLPDVYAGPAHQFASHLVSTANPRLIGVATDIYATNVDQFITASALTKNDVRFVVNHILATNPSPDQFRYIVQQVTTPGSPLNQRLSGVNSLLNLGILGLNTSGRLGRMEIVLDEITGGQAEAVMNAWDESIGKAAGKPRTTESVYFDNLGIMLLLESQYQGITKHLIECGIFNLTRYPLELLVSQYEELNDFSSPQGIFLEQRQDNGLAIRALLPILKRVYDQATALGHRLSAYETPKLEQWLAAADRLNISPGSIAFMLLVAHSWDAPLSDMNAIRELLAEGATICLLSCSTGAPSGMAQRLSEKLPGVEVHAPDQAAYVKKVDVGQLSDERLAFRVLFESAVVNYNTPEDLIFALTSGTGGILNERTGTIHPHEVATRVYCDGKLIRDYSR